MNELIDKEQFTRAAQLDKYGLAGLSKLLMGVLNITRINELYQHNRDKNDLEFIDAILEELGVTYQLRAEELKNVPATGACMVVANHPLGGIDGLLLIKVLSQVRPDLKVMANFLLSGVAQLNEFFIPVNPFENSRELRSNFRGLKAALDHLEDGKLLCIFPAGEVSAYNLRSKAIRDRQWQPSALKFIKARKLPVVPVHFSGQNSLLFQLLGMINPVLRTARLPAELFNKKGKPIHIRVGKAISVSEQQEFSDVFEYGRYLRARTYLLGKPITVKPFFRPALFKRKPEDVVLPRDAMEMSREIEHLHKRGYLLHENKELQVFWATSELIPNVLYEIGRLRELTFRQVGEGTGKHIDLDEFDLYYRHLFIWDRDQQKIAGAYRLGMGKEIMQRYGKRGFYLHSLFKMKRGFLPVLETSIELGRSFIPAEYQLKPMPLYLLWKGILYFILKHPDYRYLIGPVSISGEFSAYSKFLITSVVRTHYYDQQLATLVEARKAYKTDLAGEDADLESVSKVTGEDLKKLDKIIEDIELGNFRLPALLKKYLSQNAKIIAFNVDPKFNNSLDGLLVMDMYSIPFETVEGLSKELQDKEILKHFPGRKAE